jgi:hypothetical protein
MYKLLLSHGNNGNANAPVTLHVPCLSYYAVPSKPLTLSAQPFCVIPLLHVNYHVQFRQQTPKQRINLEFGRVAFPKSVPVPVLRSHPSLICSTHRCDHNHHHHHHHRIYPFSLMRTVSLISWHSAPSSSQYITRVMSGI